MLRIGLGINRDKRRQTSAGASYQPETTTYLNTIGIVNGAAVYFPASPQEITGAAIWNAVDAFVVSSKTITGLTLGINNLSTKFPFIYLMIGGTAVTNKYNLCDPQDTNAAFRISYLGGWTFSATGSLPNGVNSYGDSFLTPNPSLSLNDTHLSYYSRTASAGVANIETGADDGAGRSLAVLPRYFTGAAGYSANGTLITKSVTIVTSAFFQTQRTSATNIEFYRNKTNLYTDVDALPDRPFSKIFIGCRSLNNAPQEYTNRECAFASCGVSFTPTNQALYYDAIQALQTSLFRQV